MVDERELVREFHEAFDVPVSTGPPDLTLPDDRLRMRYRLVAEEFAELTGAILGPAARSVVERAVEEVVAGPTDGADLVATADATVDLRYVLHGLELECGIPGDEVFTEVHASNLAKLGPDGTAVRRADGKVLKPAGWRPPDVAGVLARAGSRSVGGGV
ncbi:putative HAD superfamily Cof-like phosphohydrolase [Isoptericola jiangsuensis]|uniref:Putative HAD superfamily Cof-like phosphohydrolase n=1 Tax=Isoptericola jiangsuensis TaxID=548579 RepID=A0A2A9EXQ8_9MICO|nr:phosphoribosyl-ATP diphosphatase [Isoptericola jiangsuensis]PFG43015.1 putative HAD superfamily Cof-like phosphohydrolase [Isoptericola jiangsuensis]